MVDAQTERREVVIRLDGEGVLEEAHAQALLQEYRQDIEDRHARIVFWIGKKATRTTPGFWQTLFSSVSGVSLFEKFEIVPEGVKKTGDGFAFPTKKRRTSFNDICHRFVNVAKSLERARHYQQQMVDAQTGRREVVVRIDGEGVLDEDHAKPILQKHREDIENQNVRIFFLIGKNVTRTVYDFWITLLYQAVLKNFYDLQKAFQTDSELVAAIFARFEIQPEPVDRNIRHTYDSARVAAMQKYFKQRCEERSRLDDPRQRLLLAVPYARREPAQ